jgi:hypothetical protein
MKIFIKPEDIIKRSVWDSYVQYVLLGDEEVAKNILEKNEEFQISEEDALVIGILKVLETSNLIHKFNSYIVDTLMNKSITNGGDSFIRKRSLEISIENFHKKFPEYWKPDLEYKNSLIELYNYLNSFNKELEELDIKDIQDKFGTHQFLKSNSVRKILKFNYI